MKSLSWQVIKQKAANLCVYRERTVKEVSDKLSKYGLSKEELHQIILELIKEGFIDEERYAKAFSHDKFIFHKWGKIKIRYELQKRGLSSQDIEVGLDVIREEEYIEAVSEMIRSKASTISEKDPYKLKSKIYKYMIGKGYELDLIRNQCNTAMGI